MTRRDQGVDDKVVSIMERIRALEVELEAEFAQKRAGLRYGLERGRVLFEAEVLRRHREMRTHALTYIAHAHPLILLTAPVIYGLIVPIILLDLALTVYQWICFPVYGIEKVSRRDYLSFDRSHLAYLNIIEKINCAYCSYANGLFAYAMEIGGRTERYWCPIKHAKRLALTHQHYREFAEFGDPDGFRKVYDQDRTT